MVTLAGGNLLCTYHQCNSYPNHAPLLAAHRPVIQEATRIRGGQNNPRLLPSYRGLWPVKKRPNHCSALEAEVTGSEGGPESTSKTDEALQAPEGPSTDLSVIWGRLVKLGVPFWVDEEEGGRARWRLALVIGLTLGTTGVSVLFNFLGRDFFNALSEKDPERFTQMLVKWLGGVCLGVPVYVFRDYFKDRLALEWREYMTRSLTADYFSNRTFYQVQAGALVDNPDQRISSDVRQFTDTALSFSMTILNATIDLISFSGILYSIYPPLFIALIVYSVGGTFVSISLGKPLVGLNFQQEAQEANFRYGLVRVRENAESIAFYGGEMSEERLLFQRLGAVVQNYGQLLVTSRNLQFFTSFYRFLIQILPAAVVAPLYFQGKIEFGVINQSSSAFNHILTDISLVVYQFEALAGFSAVIDRLGEFSEVVDDYATPRQLPAPAEATTPSEPPGEAALGSGTVQGDGVTRAEGPVLLAVGETEDRTPVHAPAIGLVDVPQNGRPHDFLLQLEEVTLRTPDGATTLVERLNLQVCAGSTLLIVGPSGAGKTSILRAIAGLWSSGSGTITRYGTPVAAGTGTGDIFFVPQRPYMVLGTLRDQLLYPMWANPASAAGEPVIGEGSNPEARNGAGEAASMNGVSSSSNGSERASEEVRAEVAGRPTPGDDELVQVLRRVRLEGLLSRGSGIADAPMGLDYFADWSSMLSLGEQQRLAFARVLLAKPRIVLMDESTSALDTANEEVLYAELQKAGIAYVSVGHRPTLAAFHNTVLRLLPAPAPGAAGNAQPRLSTWEVQDVKAGMPV